MKAVGDRKVCSKCRVSQGLDAYYKDRSRSDGLQLMCKPCSASYNNTVRNTNRRTRYAERYPKKHKALIVVNNMILRGKLQKQPCFLCGTTKVDGHHLNYDFPDKVVWLCRKHHSEVHHEIK